MRNNDLFWPLDWDRKVRIGVGEIDASIEPERRGVGPI